MPTPAANVPTTPFSPSARPASPTHPVTPATIPARLIRLPDRATTDLGVRGQFVNNGWLRANKPNVLQALAVSAVHGDKVAVRKLTTIVPGWTPPAGDFKTVPIAKIDPQVLAHMSLDSVSPPALMMLPSKPGSQQSESIYLITGHDGPVSAKSSDPRFLVSSISVDDGKPEIVIGPTGSITQKHGSYHGYPGSSSPVATAGLAVIIDVVFLGQPNDAPGIFSGHITIKTPTGSTDVPVQAQVLPGDLCVHFSSTHQSLIAGQTVDVAVSISNSGPSTTIHLSEAALPAGVTVRGLAPVQLLANGETTVQIKIAAASDAPQVQGGVLRLHVADATGKKPAEASMSVDVYLPTYEWPQDIDGKFVTARSTLTIQASGDWIWEGYLHDKSTWYGDSFSLIVGLPYKDPTTGKLTFHYEEVDGNLGAENSGPAVNKQFTKSGHSENLKANFVFTCQHGPVSMLHTEGEPWAFIVEALKDAFDLAKKYGPEIAEAVAAL